MRARGFAADVRDPVALTAALAAATAALGPVEVLQYSPIPHKDFMKPVLQTTPADLRGPLEFSVHGPVTAVQQVLPGMRVLGRGTLLFVNGGSAVRPHADRAGTSIAFAAESAYARMLHDTLAEDRIHVAQLIIPGAITPATPARTPRCSPASCGTSTTTAGIPPLRRTPGGLSPPSRQPGAPVNRAPGRGVQRGLEHGWPPTRIGGLHRTRICPNSRGSRRHRRVTAPSRVICRGS